MSIVNEHPPIIKLNDPEFAKHGVELFVYQLYLTHPTISGNKWFKLKYNLQEAKRLGLNTILTFGGAYSNHIYATAAACKEFGFSSIGIIRGERSPKLNSTLTFSESCGMQLHFIDRDKYRDKTNEAFVEKLKQQFGAFYLIPEGGSSLLGVKGCLEIMEHGRWKMEDGNIKGRKAEEAGRRTEGERGGIKDKDFEYVCCACGTGATLAGITLSLKPHQQAIGFSALKGGEFLKDEVDRYLIEYQNKFSLVQNIPGGNFCINADYHFGGYAKVSPQLIEFAKDFEARHTIPLDYTYTAKMFFGIHDLICKNYFKSGSKIIALHTGGLQGNIISK